MAASHWHQIPPSLPKKSKMWPCPDPPWTDLKIEGFYSESLLLICTSPLEEGCGTGEGQRAPCREAGEAQRGPQRPRKPRELREPKKYWFYLHFCWAKSGPGLPIHPRLQKSFPTSDFRDMQKNVKNLCIQCNGPTEHRFSPKKKQQSVQRPSKKSFFKWWILDAGAPALVHETGGIILWGQSVVLRR